MPALPTLCGREVVAVFERMGWSVVRQQVSHIIMTKELHCHTRHSGAQGSREGHVAQPDSRRRDYRSRIP